MENEKLKIFDDNHRPIGVVERAEAHQKGYWHETFNCWFVSHDADANYIYLQHRSPNKKDYPNLLDITAAGHLLADESIEDGIREVEEELGVFVPFKELRALGVAKGCIISDGMTDKEFAHVFLYPFKGSFHDFKLQEEEVSGMYRTPLTDFCELWLGELEEITIEGFESDSEGKRVNMKKTACKKDFVPQYDYFKWVAERLRQHI